MLNAENGGQPLDQVMTIDGPKGKRRKYLIWGTLAVAVFVLYLLLILGGAAPESLLIPVLAVAGATMVVGMRVYIWDSNWTSYITGIGSLKEIEPPEVVVTKDYAVTKHMNTYVFVIKRAPLAIYFIAFEGANLSPATKVDVPRNFLGWDTSIELIKGYRVHKRTGVFSIPTPELGIVSGEGVLYALPFLRMSPMVSPKSLGSGMRPVSGMTREIILAVAELASKSASNGVS